MINFLDLLFLFNFQGGCTKKLLNKSGGPHQGEITLTTEELIHSREFYHFSFQILNLPTGFFQNPNHFFEIRRADESGKFRLVKRTAHKSGKSIVEDLAISGTELNNGDNERTLEIQLFHYKGIGYKQCKLLQKGPFFKKVVSKDLTKFSFIACKKINLCKKSQKHA